MKIVTNSYEREINLETASREELLDLKLALEQDLDGIQVQLTAARASAAADGEYADKDWYMRATYARRMKGRQIQAIQRALAKKKRSEHRGVAEIFMDLARARIDRQLFYEMLDEARELAGEQDAQP